MKALLSPRVVSADAKTKALEAAAAVVVSYTRLMGSEFKRLLHV